MYYVINLFNSEGQYSHTAFAESYEDFTSVIHSLNNDPYIRKLQVIIFKTEILPMEDIRIEWWTPHTVFICDKTEPAMQWYAGREHHGI